MYRQIGILALLALVAQGCSSKPGPKPISLASFFKTDYQSWNCQQLADEADLLNDALAVATDHEPDAHTRERVAHIKRASQAVRDAATIKGCKA